MGRYRWGKYPGRGIRARLTRASGASASGASRPSRAPVARDHAAAGIAAAAAVHDRVAAPLRDELLPRASLTAGARHVAGMTPARTA